MSGLFAEPEGVLGWLAAFFVLALTPAFCEEYLFRGFLLSSLRGHMKDGSAIVITAVLFGLFHLDVYRLFGTAALGVLLGILTVRTKSVFPAVLVHALNNGTAVIAAMIGVESMRLDLPLVGAAALSLGFALYGLAKLPGTSRPT
jgi:membrane protease YdiL (CAAX protease family)